MGGRTIRHTYSFVCKRICKPIPISASQFRGMRTRYPLDFASLTATAANQSLLCDRWRAR
ncbi:hypothetical protein IV72_GL000968 [Atopobium minutum]|nr:hypothetical protein HMPREF1247_0568 [Atopobium sp. BV3Ac4]KRN55449.1 hypothetical protein IV72_GL000968 [Atopobium minutum]